MLIIDVSSGGGGGEGAPCGKTSVEGSSAMACSALYKYRTASPQEVGSSRKLGGRQISHIWKRCASAVVISSHVITSFRYALAIAFILATMSAAGSDFCIEAAASGQLEGLVRAEPTH